MANKKEIPVYLAQATQIFFRLGFIALVFGASFLILKPFLTPIIWGGIIAIAVYPFHQRVSVWLGNRAKLSAVLLSLVGLVIVVIPVMLFGHSIVESVKVLASSIEAEQLHIPLPDKKVKEWAVVGDFVYNSWHNLATDLGDVMHNNRELLGRIAGKLTTFISILFKSVFLLLISILISAALLVFAKTGEKVAHMAYRVVLRDRAEEMVALSANTVRTVVQGVLGTALIQAFFLSLPLFFLHIPAVGFIAIIILFLAVAQIPTIIVMLPLVIYVFSADTTLVAVLFMVWSIVWSVSDNVLKPILMGKGAGAPMLVVLLGAIGGMVWAGPIGLFIGAVVLALAFNIVVALVDEESAAK